MNKARWYAARSGAKHLEQIVVEISGDNQVPPRVKNLVALFMMHTVWAGLALFMDSEPTGPFIFVKATNVVEKLRRRPVRIAFSFYKLNYGGLVQIFVYVPCEEIESESGKFFVTEAAYWPDNEEHMEVLTALIDRKKLEAHFVAPGANGPCTGYFGISADFSDVCRAEVKKRFDALIAYHKTVPAARRNFQYSLNQYNAANPLNENPVQPKPFWRFWK